MGVVLAAASCAHTPPPLSGQGGARIAELGAQDPLLLGPAALETQLVELRRGPFWERLAARLQSGGDAVLVAEEWRYLYRLAALRYASEAMGLARALLGEATWAKLAPAQSLRLAAVEAALPEAERPRWRRDYAFARAAVRCSQALLQARGYEDLPAARARLAAAEVAAADAEHTADGLVASTRDTLSALDAANSRWPKQ